MNEVMQKILGRVKKLLAMADRVNNATQSEAETAMALAKKLMIEHNISMSDVEVKELNSAPTDTQEAAIIRNFNSWKKRIFHICDVLFDTRHYQSRTGLYGKEKKIIFYGLKVDVELSLAVYPILSDTCKSMARKYKTTADKNAYLEGLTRCLYERAKEFKPLEVTPEQPIDVAHQEQACRAIMVVKENVLANMSRDLGLRHTNRRTRDRSNNPIYAHGFHDGKSVSLNFRNSIENGGE